MNFLKSFLAEGGMRGGKKAFREIKTLIEVSSLLMLDPLAKLWPASLSSFPARLAKILTKRLRQTQDLGVIATV